MRLHWNQSQGIMCHGMTSLPPLHLPLATSNCLHLHSASNHSNMLDSAGIQPTFSWQLLFLVEDTQSLILAAIAYCRCTPWTFYHHKIALNHSFPTVPVSLNLAQRLLSYKPIFACSPHVHHVHPCTPGFSQPIWIRFL